MRPSGIGGQAVIEGVMMKNKDQYAVAVRKPNNEIAIEKNNYVSIAEKYKIFKLPIFRGMLAFVESMIVGTKTLTFSASFFEEEEEVKPSKLETTFSKVFKEKAESVAMGITFFLSIILAVGLFIMFPLFVASLLSKVIESEVLLTIIEGCFRILLFVVYVLAITQVKDIKRMFMYHGAEHKTINCLEQGFELTVENVKWQSKQHKRCGTSFMFIVMFISIIFFIFIRVDQGWLRYLIRILLIPIIAGVSYEFIRLAGKSNSKLVNILSQPGMWMQGLTTKEPDDDMIEVAIQSVEAVFDWREFLAKSDNKSLKNRDTSKSNVKKQSTPNNKQNNVKSNIDKKNVEVKKEVAVKNEVKIKKDIEIKKDVVVKKEVETKKNVEIKKDVKIKKDEEIKKETVYNNSKQQASSTNKEQSNHGYNKAKAEIAVTTEKTVGVKPKSIMNEEEDDEILRALDRFLDISKESKDKE